MSHFARTLDKEPLPAASLNITSMAIVDAVLERHPDWLVDSHDGMEVHILNEHEDGVAQILSLLQRHQQLTKLSLICKGTSSQIVLGQTCLSETNLWMYADAIREWRNYLTKDAKILIHGCDLAVNRKGQALVSWLGLLANTCVQVV